MEDLDKLAEELAAQLLDYLTTLLPEDDPSEGKLGDRVLMKALAAYRAVLEND